MNKSIFTKVFSAAVITAISMVSEKSYGQYRFFDKPVYEIGINVGPANLLGDLGGRYGVGTSFLKDNNIEMTSLAKGGYFTVRPSEFFGLTLAVNFTTLTGADSIIVDKGGPEVARKNRNLSVSTPIKEATLTAEIYPTVFFEQSDKELWNKFRPYGVIGVGVFHFNPRGEYIAPDGSRRLVDLQPLRTEGQGMPQYPDRKPYSLTQINIPYGVGVRYYFNDRLNAGLEIVNRKTFTDYIDDIGSTFINDSDFDSYFGAGSSTAEMAKQMHNKAQQVGPGTRIHPYNGGDKRGTPDRMDSYYTISIKVGFRFSSNSGNVLKCPVVF
ncbi:MAG: hypothetical protein KIT80_01805 [Chitinophagaceae bacterium]|nr:hypothetical protein [Chitinophagaceae bacterium]MCW5925620.1 hypothetical protein [Chitinophagaceae bacterium]